MISKLKQEHEHYARLIERGMNSLAISDELTHIMLIALEDGFKKRYPTEDGNQIRARMINHVLAIQKARSKMRKENEEKGRIATLKRLLKLIKKIES